MLSSKEALSSVRVNLVPIPPVVTSPRDMALAAVICSALATVLLALLILCVIYFKRQLLEKKPSASLRSQDGPYSGAELSCLDRRRLHDFPQHPCCQCHHGPGHTCGPVHLIPSLCCDESCSLGRSRDTSPFQSQISLNEGCGVNPCEENVLAYLKAHPEPCISREAGETWLLMQNPDCAESLGSPCCNREEDEEEEEEGCRSSEDTQEKSTEQARQSQEKTGALTEVLLPKHQPSSLEGQWCLAVLYEL
ncbi:unnamed protein product [Oncorhynchus mykiss]|uniref:TNFR-Cys domain-containing protein n=1 Tax=Oncorhynchus mykiss TaxID=8022 RepID=A0A060YD52_ONCMY|nr:unnamed protein product [Oncorhynchus mykiss]